MMEARTQNPSVEQRLLTCFSAVFPERSGTELVSASREAMQEWDSLASVTLLTVVNEEFDTGIDLFDFQNLGSFQSLLEYLQATTGAPAGSVSHD